MYGRGVQDWILLVRHNSHCIQISGEAFPLVLSSNPSDSQKQTTSSWTHTSDLSWTLDLSTLDTLNNLKNWLSCLSPYATAVCKLPGKQKVMNWCAFAIEPIIGAGPVIQPTCTENPTSIYQLISILHLSIIYLSLAIMLWLPLQFKFKVSLNNFSNCMIHYALSIINVDNSWLSNFLLIYSFLM